MNTELSITPIEIQLERDVQTNLVWLHINGKAQCAFKSEVLYQLACRALAVAGETMLANIILQVAQHKEPQEEGWQVLCLLKAPARTEVGILRTRNEDGITLGYTIGLWYEGQFYPAMLFEHWEGVGEFIGQLTERYGELKDKHREMKAGLIKELEAVFQMPEQKGGQDAISDDKRVA